MTMNAESPVLRVSQQNVLHKTEVAEATSCAVSQTLHDAVHDVAREYEAPDNAGTRESFGDAARESATDSAMNYSAMHSAVCVIGLGHDVVDVSAFSDQLAESATHMRGLFSPRELRQSALRARVKNDGEAVHLAARWAGKEAVLKAWCDALGERPYPYTLDDFPWSRIEILDDARSRPRVVLAEDVARKMIESLSTSNGSTAADRLSRNGSAGELLSGVSNGFGRSPNGLGISLNGSNGSPNGVPGSLADESSNRSSGGLSGGIPESMEGKSHSYRWHISLSHDGPVASAVVLLVAAQS